SQCAEADLLVEVLDIVAQSMAQYAIDWFAALRDASIADAVSHADADAIAMIQLIASGAPIPRDYAESRLNYRLARWHRALVLWTEDPEHADAVEKVVAALRATAEGR